MKLFKKLLIVAASILLLSGCHQSTEPKNTIKVGVIAGPEAKLMEVAKQVAEKQYGLHVQIVQFNDYVMPNTALAAGDLDANMFQHLPYLQQTIQAKGYDLTPIGKTFIYPMAIYSKKIVRLADLKDEATVAIPNDPSNEARALLLLQQAGLIQLKRGVGSNATVTDITSNPKNLKITALDAAQLPRVLHDADIAVINTNFAMVAHLSPSKDGLFVEDKQSPYVNLVVVRTQDKNDPRLHELVEALHSNEVQAEAKRLFKDGAIPGW